MPPDASTWLNAQTNRGVIAASIAAPMLGAILSRWRAGPSKRLLREDCQSLANEQRVARRSRKLHDSCRSVFQASPYLQHPLGLRQAQAMQCPSIATFFPISSL